MEKMEFNEQTKCSKCEAVGAYGLPAVAMCGDCIDWEEVNFDGQGYLRNQVKWFADLKLVIKSGETETALDTIDAAIKMLRRQIGDEGSVH